MKWTAHSSKIEAAYRKSGITPKKTSVIVASRFRLAEFPSFPEYHLTEVAEEFVVRYLAELNLEDHVVKYEIQLLQKPLLFSHLMPLLDEFAFDMIAGGRETFSLEEFDRYLSSKVSELDAGSRKIFINWLIDVQKFIVPMSRQRLAFFHQTITEFLAAQQVAKMFVNDFNSLPDLLEDMRWDNVLLFTTSFLSGSALRHFMRGLTLFDSLLAVQACPYLETDFDVIGSMVLDRLLNCFPLASDIYKGRLIDLFATYPIPITEANREKFHSLMGEIGKNLQNPDTRQRVMAFIGSSGSVEWFKKTAEILVKQYQNIASFSGRSLLEYLQQVVSEKTSPEILALLNRNMPEEPEKVKFAIA